MNTVRPLSSTFAVVFLWLLSACSAPSSYYDVWVMEGRAGEREESVSVPLGAEVKVWAENRFSARQVCNYRGCYNDYDEDYTSRSSWQIEDASVVSDSGEYFYGKILNTLKVGETRICASAVTQVGQVSDCVTVMVR